MRNLDRTAALPSRASPTQRPDRRGRQAQAMGIMNRLGERAEKLVGQQERSAIATEALLPNAA
jgi:hypothetical protein